MGSDLFADEDVPVSLEEYGFDPDGLTVDEVQDEQGSVVVPETDTTSSFCVLYIDLDRA